MLQEKMQVVQQDEIAANIYRLVLTGDLVDEMTTPGQFLHLLVPRMDLLLRRPISIAEINHSLKQVTLIYRVIGNGTDAISRLKFGDFIDVVGPRGNGFPIEEVQNGETAYLIGGGIGVPPLYETAKRLHQQGVEVTALLGFRSEAESFYVDQFARYANVLVATEDGSLGEKGNVGVFMEKLPQPDVVYACGPNPMLKAVNQAYESMEDRIFLSLEERMACGIGACYGCVCESKNDPDKVYKVCEEGPIFQGGLVKL